MSYVLQLENDDFGYAVCTWEDHACIGNPDNNRYTGSLTHTGSVDVYKYNVNTDKHVRIATLYKQSSVEVLLAAETGSPTPPPISGSLFSASLSTEFTSSTNISYDAGKDLLLDESGYMFYMEDAYGQSLDIHNTTLVVGCSYYNQQLRISNTTSSFTGSCVDIYDLQKYDPEPYTETSYIEDLDGIFSGSYVIYTVTAREGFEFVDFQYTPYPLVYPLSWTTIDTLPVSIDGGTVTYQLTASYLVTNVIRAQVRKNTDPFVFTISTPHPEITESFGKSVSINENWLAVGSPEYSSSMGAVYLYQKTSSILPNTNYISWSLYQIITGSDCISGDKFGYDIELNKASGSYSGSLIIGTARPSGSRVYLFEFSSSWKESHVFDPIHELQYLPFYNIFPIYSNAGAWTIDSFGRSVSLWKDTYVIGAPTDRYVYEYSGSSLYRQGAAYIFEKCDTGVGSGFKLSLKTYGNEKTLKNNKLGQSVDVYEDKVIIGSPKINAMPSCYIQGSFFTKSEFTTDEESQLNGQFIYLQKNTSSLDWEIINVYQNKKKFVEPYINFGWDVAIHDKFVVVGSPMNLSDTNTYLDFAETQSSNTDYKGIHGKAYIYNLNNFNNSFHVGNVFYRNGILVINTSGSVFENLFLDTSSPYEYQYNLKYRGKQQINELQIMCHVEPGEFNVSTNPTSISYSIDKKFDINENGSFDVQDVDILLKYMQYKATKYSDSVNSNWTSSILSDDSMKSMFEFYSSYYVGTDYLYSSSFNRIESMENDLDINLDSRIDHHDMNILWRYFSNRLTQAFYTSHVPPTSVRKLYSDAIDFLNSRTGKLDTPKIKPEFGHYLSYASNDPTGSYLATYVTSIGLYNGLDLIAIAKLGTPIKLIPDLPYNFVVKLDI